MKHGWLAIFDYFEGIPLEDYSCYWRTVLIDDLIFDRVKAALRFNAI